MLRAMRRFAGTQTHNWHTSCVKESEPATLQLKRQHLAQPFWRTVMSKLMIADLSVAHELDRREMGAVRGGYLGGQWPVYYPTPSVTSVSTNFSAQQLIGQTNDIVNNTGNDVAFASGIHSTVNPVQTAHNTINF
jgi:hypothetical protein